MDTIVDSYGHAILTLTERSTNFVLMERLPHGRKAMPLARTVAKFLFSYRKTLRTVATYNGCEFAAHLETTRLLSMRNWEKKASENTKKLIRKYIPKKSNFNDFSDRRIMSIQKKINRRLREKLNFDTLIKRFSQYIA